MANSGRDPRNLLERIHYREVLSDTRSYLEKFDLVSTNDVSRINSQLNIFKSYSNPTEARRIWEIYGQEFAKQNLSEEEIDSLKEDISLFSTPQDLDFYLNSVLSKYETAESSITIPTNKEILALDDEELFFDDGTAKLNAEMIFGVPAYIKHPLFIKEGEDYSLNA